MNENLVQVKDYKGKFLIKLIQLLKSWGYSENDIKIDVDGYDDYDSELLVKFKSDKDLLKFQEYAKPSTSNKRENGFVAFWWNMY